MHTIYPNHKVTHINTKIADNLMNKKIAAYERKISNSYHFICFRTRCFIFSLLRWINKTKQKKKQTITHLQYKENNIWKHNKRLQSTLNQLQLQQELSALPKSYLNEQRIWRARGQQKMVSIKIWPEKQLLITYIHNIYVDIWLTDICLHGWLFCY